MVKSLVASTDKTFFLWVLFGLAKKNGDSSLAADRFNKEVECIKVQSQ